MIPYSVCLSTSNHLSTVYIFDSLVRPVTVSYLLCGDAGNDDFIYITISYTFQSRSQIKRTGEWHCCRNHIKLKTINETKKKRGKIPRFPIDLAKFPIGFLRIFSSVIFFQSRNTSAIFFNWNKLHVTS